MWTRFGCGGRMGCTGISWRGRFRLRMRRERLSGWIGSSTDIHDQKMAEEALRKSEKLATAGRLAASIAHEINNPLAGVTNALYLALLDKSLGEETLGI